MLWQRARYFKSSKFTNVMNGAQRLNVIMQNLRTSKASRVQELSNQLNVSHMIVTRDFLSLMKNEKVKVFLWHVIFHPKSIARDSESHNSLTTAGARYPELKRWIGQLAAPLIEPEEMLFIDSGSTTDSLAKYLLEGICYSVRRHRLKFGLFRRDQHEAPDHPADYRST